MIYCSINDVARYGTLISPDAIKKIKEITPETYEAGQIKIDGDKLFLNLFEYDTKKREDAVFEAHKKYIDVMYVVEGEETVYFKNTADLSRITKEYEEEGDYLLANLDEDASSVRLYPGMLLLLFPEDAHAPGCITKSSVHVKKIVGKVRV